MKKEVVMKIFNSLIILLSVFVGLFFLIYELAEVKNPIVIFASTIILTGILIFFSKKYSISNFIMLPVIIVDGFFHLTSPLENLIENSPDWIIAFNLFQVNGMPVIVHQIMGIFLLTTSGIFIYNLAKKRKNWYNLFYKYLVAIITMSIISFSYILKLI